VYAAHGISQRESYYKNFRFTPRAGVVAGLGMVVIPAGFYYLFSQTTVRPSSLRSLPPLTHTQLKFDWTAKRKGESLAK
jgi:hypothetical protein